MEGHNNFGYDGVALSLDSWSSHHSQKVKEFLQNCGCNVLYLAPYSPQLAPVELAFNQIKGIIRWKSKKRVQTK